MNKVSEYIKRGAYIAALNELETVRHPIIYTLFPKLSLSNSPDDEISNEIQLTNDEIEILKDFINERRQKDWFYTILFIGIGSFCFSIGLITLLEGSKYLDALPQLMIVGFLPCCLAVMGTPLLFFALWGLWQTFQSKTF